MTETAMFAGLGVILALVLVLPFAVKQVEHNLEVFLFTMGLAASFVSGVLTLELGIHALEEPLMISGAVLVAGVLFKALQSQVRHGVKAILKLVPIHVFLFLLVVVLGIASSLITAIIASLVLVEIVSILKLHRKAEVQLVIIACFSIGVGAALTPIGEPLSTIAVSKLNEGFWYLVSAIGLYVIPLVVALGLFAAFFVRTGQTADPIVTVGSPGLTGHGHGDEDTYASVLIRALKVYLFVMALVFLGEGFKPVIDRYVIGLPSGLLYWLNMVSAVLDNATLVAAEISDKMSPQQIKSILMGLLISGGMLIPGNIPNIISASKLKIGSREWAQLGVPLGLAIMLVVFIILMI